jgi:Replication-relaxation
MSRQRITETRVRTLERQLTTRDCDVIATLDRLRVATARQLQRLHVIDATPASNLRRMQAQLARLTDRRVLARLERQVGGVHAGSAGYVYALDVAGQRLASVCGPAGGLRIRRPWTPGHAFLDHALSVGERYVELRESERTGALELLAFDAEPLCWRSFAGVGGGRVWLKPDAFVRVGLGDFEDNYFVELDRATQSGPTIARKLRTYQRYFETGREQERHGVFPRVLFVVPSETRKAALSELAAAQPPNSWPLFQIVRVDDALATFAGQAGRADA